MPKYYKVVQGDLSSCFDPKFQYVVGVTATAMRDGWYRNGPEGWLYTSTTREGALANNTGHWPLRLFVADLKGSIEVVKEASNIVKSRTLVLTDELPIRTAFRQDGAKIVARLNEIADIDFLQPKVAARDKVRELAENYCRVLEEAGIYPFYRTKVNFTNKDTMPSAAVNKAIKYRTSWISTYMQHNTHPDRSRIYSLGKSAARCSYRRFSKGRTDFRAMRLENVMLSSFICFLDDCGTALLHSVDKDTHPLRKAKRVAADSLYQIWKLGYYPIGLNNKNVFQIYEHLPVISKV